jgi:hypothetical protein
MKLRVCEEKRVARFVGLWAEVLILSALLFSLWDGQSGGSRGI